MRRLHLVLTAVATASMVLGTMGAALADQSTGQWESRADFIFQLDKALDIQPVYPATPDFQDVPTSDPYYGYIEAAFQAGITNGITQGVFGPSLALTRAEAAKYLVIAFGAGAAAQNITSTSFGDNANIPSALVGYVGEASALGLMKGFPDGNFHPDSNLTTVQEGYLVSQLTTAMSSLTLKVTASSSDVAPGQLVMLSTSGTTTSGTSVASPLVTYSVTGTNAASALVSGNTFVGSVPGNYTVQAASGTATATTQVAVYGAAAGLKVSAPTSIVANGASTATATVSVVDANGNVVANNTDPLYIDTSSTAAAGFLIGSSLSKDSGDVNAVNGVATFTLTAGSVAGATETLTPYDDSANLNGAAATLTAAAQVPTSVSVAAASPYIAANGTNGADTLSGTVLDQTGNPMLSGAYTVSFSASGPANFGGSATAAGVYYGPSGSAATATLNDVQGSTGAVTVTATGTGLTSGTASVTAVIAGAPSQIALSGAQTLSADKAHSPGATYTVTLEDSHGYPAVWEGTGPAAISVSDATGAITGSALIANGQDSQTVTLQGSTAGSYALTASDSADSLTSGTSTLTITAGAIASATITPGSTDAYQLPGADWNYAGGEYGFMLVPTSSPKVSVSFQLADQFGNPVSQAGVQVEFDLYSGCDTWWWACHLNAGTGTLTVGSASVTTTTRSDEESLIADTNSSGQATATLTMQAYSGDDYQVEAWTPYYDGPDVATPNLQLSENTAATNPVTLYNSSGAAASSLVSGQSGYYGQVGQLDSYGNRASANSGDGTEDVLLTVGGTGSATLGGPNVYPASNSYPGLGANQYIVDLYSGDGHFTVTPQKAGTLTITAQAVDVYGVPSSTTSYSVTPGTNVGQLGFSSGGTGFSQTSGGLSVTAGTEYAVTVTAEDAGGNPIVAPSTIPVSLSAEDQSSSAFAGEFRLSASGTDVNSGTSTAMVDIPAGQSSATFYFIPKSSGTVDFDASSFSYTVTDGGPYTGVAPGATQKVTFTVKDASGTPVPGVAVAFGLSTANYGSLSRSSGVTGSDGTVSVTFTAPSSNWTSASSDKNYVTAAVQGVTGTYRDTTAEVDAQ